MSVQTTSTRWSEARSFDASGWVTSLGYIARSYGISFSAQAALNGAAWSAEAAQTEILDQLGRNLGLRIKVFPPEQFELTALRLPLVCELQDGRSVVVLGLSAEDQARLIFGPQNDEITMPKADLLAQAQCFVVARPARSLVDARVDDYIAPYREGWLRRLALPDLRPYGHILLASATANILGLTGIIFSKQVYDRVIPAESFNTLYVLFIGVMLAAAFDYVMRLTRTSIVDILGKRADMRLSDHVFGHAMRVRSEARPKSTGAFVAQLRDLDALREILTSSTVSILADLPFFFLFLFVFWYIGGPLVLVPAIALVLMILPGIFAQPRLKRYVNEGMREASMRNAMLIEAVQGLDDIKMLQAEERFQQRWNHFNAVSAEAQLKQRGLTSALQSWGQAVQMGVFATVIFVGAPMVIAGDLSVGTLVACSILGSRMMAPMAQLSQLFSKLQQAKLSFGSIDGVLQMPVDRPEQQSRIGVASLSGAYRASEAEFFRDAEQKRAVLSIERLSIAAGERVAVLGRIGAGKSTLLQALAGMMTPAKGQILLDDMALAQIDTFDLRRDIGLLTQDSKLFHGTIRENLLMGAPLAPDAQIMAALKVSGALDFVAKSAQGLDYPLLEDGRGLSGGQRQALLLARLILRDPKIVLLDEPTASMDEVTERQLIASLRTWAVGRTLVIATHRMRVLDLVDRVIVVDAGKITFDGDRSSFLRRGQLASAARPQGSAARAPRVKMAEVSQ